MGRWASAPPPGRGANPDLYAKRALELQGTPCAATQGGCQVGFGPPIGLIAGFIASKLVNKTGSGVMLDIILGIVGAVVGGWLFSAFGGAGVTGFNIYSMIVAVIGAIIVLLIYHAVAGRRTV